MAKTPAGTLVRRHQDVSLIYVSVEMFLQRVKLVSLTYVPVRTSLRRLKLIGFTYVPVRHRDDVMAWSRTILVIKVDKFYLGTRHLWWFSLIKAPASMSLKLLKDIVLI